MRKRKSTWIEPLFAMFRSIQIKDMKLTSKKEREFLKESNAIEGIYDSHSLWRAEKAWEYLKSQDHLTTEVVQQVHKILMTDSDLIMNQIGSYRTCSVSVGGRMSIHWVLVIEEMKSWIGDANNSVHVPGKGGLNIKIDHVQYEKIHPFVDGNGRTGRIFMNWQRRKAGLPILIIRAEERGEYYKWFKDL